MRSTHGLHGSKRFVSLINGLVFDVLWPKIKRISLSRKLFLLMLVVESVSVSVPLILCFPLFAAVR